MWARQIELCLGLWLLLSPFVFRHAANHGTGRPDLWAIDLGCGSVIVVLALLCHWWPARRSHLGHLLVAGLLVGSGWLGMRGDAAAPAAASYQNHIVVGLLLATFAIVPSNALHPPEGWLRFHEEMLDARERGTRDRKGHRT